MDLLVTPSATGWQAAFGDKLWPCAIGRGGVTNDKREGDGATPIGNWPLRQVFYRADRLARPKTVLATRVLSPEDGWCDASEDARYNLPVTLPYAGRHEELWRQDAVYDVIVPLGYNDDPPRAGKGSAIFLHLARPDFSPTEGCVALERTALLQLLEAVTPASRVSVEGPL